MGKNLSDYEIGKLLFRFFFSFDKCANDEQRRGWNDAENALAWRVWIETSPQQRDFITEVTYA